MNDGGKYTIIELADEAIKQNISLGSNPIRTIRYYVSIGLLKKPQIAQDGKKRISYFNEEQLLKLKVIDFYKKQGLTLEEIKNKLSEKLYWSDEGVNYLKKFSDEVPENTFIKGKPITNAEMAFFLVKIQRRCNNI